MTNWLERFALNPSLKYPRSGVTLRLAANDPSGVYRRAGSCRSNFGGNTMNRFLTLLAFLVLASSAFASSTTCPLPNSPYSGYLGGFSCVSGNLMFNDFFYSATPGSPSASDVMVTPLTDTN